MTTHLHALRTRLEQSLVGALPPDVRRNMVIELGGSVVYGLFYGATVQFVPVVLRRMGASPDLLAFYIVQTYLGSILAALSIVMMRRRRTQTFAVVCWLLGRSLFLFYVGVTDVRWLLVLTGLFWLLETFPSPAYARIIQHIYPDAVRGKVLSLIRMGMVAAILLSTPLAGWLLDEVGYRVLFPIAALCGIAAALAFARLRVDEGALPPRHPQSMSALINIVRTNRRFALYLLGFAVYGLGAMMGYAFYAIVQVDRLQLSYTQIGLLGLAQSVAWLLSFLYWGRQVDLRGGIWVTQMNCAIAVVIPLSYIWADTGWMLLPAFIAQGIISAGIDLGLINAGIQLAEPGYVAEYAAVQATVVGLRGIVAPILGVLLLRLGMPDVGIFAIGALLIALSWLIFARIALPPPTADGRPWQTLRYRWPIRFRLPRF